MEANVPRSQSRQGERNGQAKLTSAKVEAIMRDGRPQREIAGDFGVHHTAIAHIKAGRNWRWLTGVRPR